MGTRAKCTKCGVERFVNTKFLKAIHKQFGIRPIDWIHKFYICKECKRRIKSIKQSDIDNIVNNLEQFRLECVSIYNGLYYEGTITKDSWIVFCNKIKNLMESHEIKKYNFVVSNKVIVGIQYEIPIIGTMYLSLLQSGT